jgi:hypothetical protein
VDAVQSRAARTARGWITGAVATAAAAVSHGLADGAAPSALALGGALVFAGVLGTFLVGRRASLPRLMAIVAMSQLAFHLVFSYLTPGTATAAGHHDGPALLEPAVAHHGTEPGMWAAHALALLVTIVFLRRAELALWSLLREAFRVVPAVRPVLVPTRSPAPAGATAAPRHPVPAPFLSIVSHRGPPAAGFAF